MALIDSEGFGFSTTIADYVTYNILASFVLSAGGLYSSSISTGGPLGDNYLSVMSNVGPPYVAGYKRNVAFGSSSVFVGTRINANTNIWCVALIDSTTAVALTVQSNTSGGATIVAGSTTLATIANGTFPLTGWFYLEIGAVIASGTSGSVIAKLNGVAVSTTSGVNTEGGSSTTIASVGFLGSNTSGAPTQYAHLYFSDNIGSAPWNTFLGDVRVQTLFPTSNDSVQFTPNGLGANWQNAAKMPPVPATDFNNYGTIGGQDTFNCGTIASGLSTVFGVNVKALIGKTDAGTRSAENVLISGTTTATGTSTPIAVSALPVKTMFQTDPNTSAAWTASAVNAAKPGYKISA